MSDMLESVEFVWVLWIASIAAMATLVTVSYLAVRKRRAGTELVRDERASAYMISFVFCVPVYAMLMLLILETSLMLMAKCGTTYAAFAAARSASVHASYHGSRWNRTTETAEWAAAKTMAPYASGLVDRRSISASRERSYAEAYQEYVEEPAYEPYLEAKLAYAVRHVEVDLGSPPAKWNSDVVAKVKYEYPFLFPFIGRILGDKGSGGRFVYSIESSATVPNEGPQNEAQDIGIPYGRER